MCLLLVMRAADGSLALAANRDERRDRPSRPPHIWPIEPPILAGRDEQAKGTWLAVNAAGVVAAVTNRPTEDGHDAGRPTRGRLPLLACACRSATEAKSLLRDHLRTMRYNGFNLFIADAAVAFVIEAGGPTPRTQPVPPGLAICGNSGWDDRTDARVARAYELLASLPIDAQSAIERFGEVCRDNKPIGTAAALCTAGGDAGTVSSTLLRLDAHGQIVQYLHAPGPPCNVDYEAVGNLDSRFGAGTGD